MGSRHSMPTNKPIKILANNHKPSCAVTNDASADNNYNQFQDKGGTVDLHSSPNNENAKAKFNTLDPKANHRKNHKQVFRYKPIASIDCHPSTDTKLKDNQERKRFLLPPQTIPAVQTKSLSPSFNKRKVSEFICAKNKKPQQGLKINWFSKPRKNYGQLAQQLKSYQIIMGDNENTQSQITVTTPSPPKKIVLETPRKPKVLPRTNLIKTPPSILLCDGKSRRRSSKLWGASKFSPGVNSPLSMDSNKVHSGPLKPKGRKSGLLHFLLLNRKQEPQGSATQREGIIRSTSKIKGASIKRKNAFTDDINNKPKTRDNSTARISDKKESIAITLNEKYKNRYKEKKVNAENAKAGDIPEGFQSRAEKKRYWAGEKGKFDVDRLKLWYAALNANSH